MPLSALHTQPVFTRSELYCPTGVLPAFQTSSSTTFLKNKLSVVPENASIAVPPASYYTFVASQPHVLQSSTTPLVSTTSSTNNIVSVSPTNAAKTLRPFVRPTRTSADKENRFTNTGPVGLVKQPLAGKYFTNTEPVGLGKQPLAGKYVKLKVVFDLFTFAFLSHFT